MSRALVWRLRKTSSTFVTLAFFVVLDNLVLIGENRSGQVHWQTHAHATDAEAHAYARDLTEAYERTGYVMDDDPKVCANRRALAEVRRFLPHPQDERVTNLRLGALVADLFTRGVPV